MSEYGSHKFYKELKSYFISIRFSSARKWSDEEKNGKLLYYKNVLEPFLKELQCHISENENHVLIYCIDMLLDIIEEGDCTKINCFADTIHNMPEICMGVRPLKTFHSEISIFRSSYGQEYFPFSV